MSALTGPDPAFDNVGREPGLLVWRVENQRGTSERAAAFGVAPWPAEKHGVFHRGDSYVALKTRRAGPSGDALAHDVHFWLGSASSQDERAVAAIKAVELDDALGGLPVQHRETEGHESDLFSGYFPKGLRYLDGGVDSGFTAAAAREVAYETRLFHVRRAKRATRAFQVPAAVSSLNHGDCFVLDEGLTVTAWFGDEASPFEKAKAAELVDQILAERHGHARRGDAEAPAFWQALGPGASPADVGPPEHEPVTPAEVDPRGCKLFRISDAAGVLSFTREHEGEELHKSMLDSDDAFVIDVGSKALFVWVGSGASKAEASRAMEMADGYIQQHGLQPFCPVTRLNEGFQADSNKLFQSCFAFEHGASR